MPFSLILKTISIGITLKATDNSSFLTLKAKLAFFQLKKAFIEVSILYYFHPKHYIHIEINTFDYIIDDILRQLISESS